MKAITIYETYDNQRFDIRSTAASHEEDLWGEALDDLAHFILPDYNRKTLADTARKAVNMPVSAVDPHRYSKRSDQQRREWLNLFQQKLYVLSVLSQQLATELED